MKRTGRARIGANRNANVLRALAFFIAFLLPLSFIADAKIAAIRTEMRPIHPWKPMPTQIKKSGAPFSAPALAGAPALSRTTWTAIGPAPLSETLYGYSNVSGRITGIATDPTNPNNIYIAAAGGGVWKTTYGGSSWTPLTDTQVTLSMGAISVAPTNPNKIYAGTGEANNAGDSNYGRGILTSSNGGTTWSLSKGPVNVFSNERFAIAQISVDPTAPNTAYAAVTLAGENGTLDTHGGTGIYKTTDGGTTWTNMTQVNNQDDTYSWSAVIVDPNNPAIIYAAHGYDQGDSTNGVYQSSDSGVTWSLLSGPPNGSTNTATGRIALAVAPSASTAGSHVLYVAIEDNTTSGLLYFGRSDNADAATPAFTDLTSGTPNFLGGQGWYDIVIGADPSKSAIVYASGVVNYSTDTQLVIRSIDSGQTWSSDISTINGFGPHTDSHAMAFDSSGRMLLGNDGGIYRYDPAGPSWTDLNGNLETIQFTGIGLHPTNPSIAIGGSQDNGTQLYNGSTLWTETDGGDGGFAKFSSTNPSRVYHQIPYASNGTGFFQRSDDGGNTWTAETLGISTDVNVQDFYAPFIVDPGNGDHVLYGTNRVWETNDGGDLWTNISDANTAGFTNNSNNIDAVALSPSDANTIYAATGGDGASSSQIFVTTNHGATWTERDLGVQGHVKDIQVDPANAQIAYAAINTFNSPSGQVYKTSNGGTSWTNISGNLPSEPVWSLQIDPNSAGTLYAGADDGVYVTTTGGATWSRFGTGLPNVQVYQIELNTHLNILGAATYGRGMWEIQTPGPATHFGVSAPLSAITGTAVSFTVTALDAANNTVVGYSGTVHFTSTDPAATLPVNLTLTNGAGTFTATFNTAGRQTITATDTTSAGITGTSNPLAVSWKTTHFTVSAPSSATAGTAISFTVTALDAGNNVVTGYSGKVRFSSADPASRLPAMSTLSNGIGTFTGTLNTPGSWTITASDTVSSSVNGTSNTVAVNRQPSRFVVLAHSPATVGNAVSFTVTALDSNRNTVTGYSGTVHFTSTDPAATLPTDSLLTNGTGTFTATFNTAGSQIITATDTVSVSIAGISNSILVSGAATHFAVSAPTTAITGNSFSFTVTALDSNRNTVTGYSGTAHFTGTDAAASLPADSTLTNGKGTFTATLNTAGSQTITAADTVATSTTGTSNVITANQQRATHFVVTAPSSATAGTAANFTVTALDATNHTVTGYSGTVHFTSTDAMATLPADCSLTIGTGTFQVTFNTAGSRTITAKDTVTATITGTSNVVAVSGTATHFAVSAPLSTTAGTAISFNVTALDAGNRVVIGYLGAAHFASTDATATLPADSTLTNGKGTFTATLNTIGSQTLTATDAVTTLITGTSNTITIRKSPTFFVSGTVTTSRGAPISGVLMTLNGGQTTTTDATGKYWFTNLINGTYTVTPTKTGYVFGPSSSQVIVRNAVYVSVNFRGQ